MAKRSKGLGKMMKKLKKQNKNVKVVLILLAVFLVYKLFKKMRWIGGNNSYLEGMGIKSDKTFVFFKMNGCPHCVKMEPEWKKFVDSKPSCKTKTLEASANKKEAKKYGVTGFPSLLMVSGGKVIDTYNGERNAEGFKKFAAKHSN